MSVFATLPEIALVVPSLEQGGGVPSVAGLICQTVERSSAYEYRYSNPH